MAAMIINIEDCLLREVLNACSDDESLEEFIENALKLSLGTPIEINPAFNLEELAAEALIKSDELEAGKKFVLTDLLPSEVWESISSGSRKQLGKIFRQAAFNENPPTVEYTGTNRQNKAVYLKLPSA